MSGVFMFQNGEWAEFEMPPNSPESEGVQPVDAVHNITFARDGTLVVAGSYEEEQGTIWLLMTFGDGKWNVINLPAETVGPVALAKGPDGSVWAATTESLMLYEDRQWRVMDGVDAVRVTVGGDETVWFRTYHGGALFQWPDTSRRVADGVQDMWADRSGTLWVSGAAEAFGDWNLYRMVDGKLVLEATMESTMITDMAFGSDDQIWAVSSVSGIHHFDGTSWTVVEVDTEVLRSPVVNSVAVAADGTVWFGTASGILHFKPEGG